MNLRGQWQKLAGMFDRRPRAEKLVIAVLLLAVIGWLYLLLLSDPLRTDLADMQRQVDTVQARIESVRARVEAARQAARENPDEAARERLARLREQQEEVNGQIRSLAGNLVSPDAMTRLLTSVLDRQPGLELVRVENREPEPLRDLSQEPEDGDGNALAAQQVYRHALVLEFEGDFFSTLRYLLFLENESRGFFWDRFHLRPGESGWPESRVTLEIHTLSADEGFVGV